MHSLDAVFFKYYILNLTELIIWGLLFVNFSMSVLVNSKVRED